MGWKPVTQVERLCSRINTYSLNPSSRLDPIPPDHGLWASIAILCKACHQCRVISQLLFSKIHRLNQQVIHDCYQLNWSTFIVSFYFENYGFVERVCTNSVVLPVGVRGCNDHEILFLWEKEGFMFPLSSQIWVLKRKNLVNNAF